MTSKPRGLYRVQGEKGKPNTAFIESGTLGFYVPERRYREEGFEPDFDALPCEPRHPAVETSPPVETRKAGKDAGM